MGAAAAIAGGVAAAGLGGALISGSAAKSAANTQAAAADTATQASEAEAAKTQATLSPYVTAGNTATTNLSNALTNPASELAQLQATPGYNFALQQGLEATQNSYAPRGLAGSGAAEKGAAQYAEGLAENTYQSNLLNPLQFLANQGENAAAQTGALGTQNVANANATTVGAANASAAGTVGAANAASGALSTLGGLPTNYLLYNSLLGGGGGGLNFYGGGPSVVSNSNDAAYSPLTGAPASAGINS
jgi:hypothetical protein